MRRLSAAGGAGYIRWADLPDPAHSAFRHGVRVFLHGIGTSSTYDFTEIAPHAELAKFGIQRRSLLVDLLGFGYSDRPDAFGYTLEEHADAVAAVLDAQKIQGAEVVGHSMGGAVALALAWRRPELVGRLTLAESNLRAGGGVFSGKITAYSEEDFLNGGLEEFLEPLDDPDFLATARAASPRALHRSAVGLTRGTEPQLGEIFRQFDGPKAFLIGELSEPYAEKGDAEAAGAHILIVPNSAHLMPYMNPDGFAKAVATASARRR